MRRAEKVELVKELKKKLKEAKAFILADYKGVNVKEAEELRRKMREAGLEYRVAKNTLLRRALSQVDEAKLNELEQWLAGPTAVGLAYEEPLSLPKVLYNFAKERDCFEIKGGVFDGKVVDASEIKRLASLPSKEELLAKFLGSLRAPLVNLLGVIQGPQRQLVSVLSQVAQGKEG
jgi:large subunit ribosomal protein L10